MIQCKGIKAPAKTRTMNPPSQKIFTKLTKTQRKIIRNTPKRGKHASAIESGMVKILALVTPRAVD